MQKRLIFFGVILSIGLFFNFSSAFAEEILDFHSDITVQKDSVLLIKETIIYDFGNLQKHGIYRDIPLGNSDIKIQKVLDENGAPYKYSVSRQGGNLKIKIGDANFTISGAHTYDIFYSVSGGLRFFGDHDELYWNVTGNDWQVPIGNSSEKITLPQKPAENNLQFACFAGFYGSKTSECNWQADAQGNIIFESTRNFSSGEGLTIVLGWPKGLVKQSIFTPLIIWFKNFWPIFIPILVFIFLFRKWWKKGRDIPLKGPIIAQYEPPENLRPAQVGVIMRQNFSPVDISATIIDLAVRGYIKIREIEKKGIFGSKDYEIIKLKDKNAEDLNDFERALLDRFFLKSLLSEIKKEFYLHMPILKEKIFLTITSLGYFYSNPESVRSRFLLIGTGMVFLALILGFFSPLLFLAMGASGILFIIFSFFMPKRTEKGAEAYWNILGFKEYINAAEKYRLQFAEKENIFEKYLPYAIVFGSVEKWAKAFEGIYKTPPSWYEGHYTGVFTASVFINSFNGALSGMNGMASGGRSGSGGSGFGGGGFSGGGGGGGGGGSW